MSQYFQSHMTNVENIPAEFQMGMRHLCNADLWYTFRHVRLLDFYKLLLSGDTISVRSDHASGITRLS
jgi:hypothetical protein